MPRAYSKDLRERLVAAYESRVGHYVEVAQRCDRSMNPGGL
jgi:hypothetical protein